MIEGRKEVYGCAIGGLAPERGDGIFTLYISLQNQSSVNSCYHIYIDIHIYGLFTLFLSLLVVFRRSFSFPLWEGRRRGGGGDLTD